MAFPISQPSNLNIRPVDLNHIKELPDYYANIMRQLLNQPEIKFPQNASLGLQIPSRILYLDNEEDFNICSLLKTNMGRLFQVNCCNPCRDHRTEMLFLRLSGEVEDSFVEDVANHCMDFLEQLTEGWEELSEPPKNSPLKIPLGFSIFFKKDPDLYGVPSFFTAVAKKLGVEKLVHPIVFEPTPELINDPCYYLAIKTEELSRIAYLFNLSLGVSNPIR